MTDIALFSEHGSYVKTWIRCPILNVCCIIKSAVTGPDGAIESRKKWICGHICDQFIK
jgi:hypothetical protein